MQRLAPALLALAFAAAAAGCASKADMDARYQASLQRWQGATRADLEAAWGRPKFVQQAGDSQVLTWIVRMDVDDRPGAATPGTVVVHQPSPTGPATVTTVAPALTMAPAQVPITCTTHFVLKDGRVTSWTFEGLGCGAPT